MRVASKMILTIGLFLVVFSWSLAQQEDPQQESQEEQGIVDLNTDSEFVMFIGR